MKLIEAGSTLSNANALKLFKREAFCSAPDYSPVAGLVAGYQLLAKSLTDLQTALWAVLFFVTNPFLSEISIIPFQEILMLGALCFATYLYIEKRIAGASLVLTLACLTRYEAWIACPFFALDYLLQNRKTFRTAVTAVALFCWAPLAWIGWHLGCTRLSTPWCGA
jgi:Gpi18-like mannosyltransferase